MADSKIELRKIRDFGGNLSDTFEFIREHFKPMMSSFVAIAGIFILLMAVMNGILESSLFTSLHTFERAGNGRVPLIWMRLYSGYTSLPSLLYFLSIWVGYTAMLVTIVAYMKYADENGGAAPGIDDVWKIFSRYYLKMLLYMVPVILLIAVGTLLCLAPGIFLAVVLVPFGWVVMTEDAGFSTAVKRCFDLTRDNFWISLCIYLVSTLIYSFAAAIIGMLAGFVSGLAGYITTKDLTSTIGIASSVVRIFGFLFYVIFLVSAGLHYYNLVEKLDAVGMTRRIGQIGESKDGAEDRSTQF